jgi:hypothetical protein
MKHTLLLLPLALVSCASLAPPTEEQLEARALAAVGGTFSAPAPVELTILPDYVVERVTLVRGITVRHPVNGPEVKSNNDDMPLGVSLGGGLFLDAQNNLAVRLDLAAGMAPDFKGTTVFWTERPGSAFGMKVTYTPDSIEIYDPKAIMGGTSKVDPTLDGMAIRGVWLSQKADKSEVVGLTTSGFSKIDSGVRRHWTEGLEFSMGGPHTMDFLFRNGRVMDRPAGSNLLVQPNGKYVRVSYGFDPIQKSFRVYRSDNTTVFINEDSGAMVVVRKTDNGVEWQNIDRGAPIPAFKAQGRLEVRPAL